MFKKISSCLILSLVLALSLAAPAQADTIYESATAGTPVQSGFTVDSRFYLGVRFQASSNETALRIGGNFFAFNNNQNIFGAVIALNSATDFPNDYPLTNASSDVLGFALLNLPNGTSQDVVATLNTPVNLTAGSYYALVFGSGVFGATGSGAASANNTDIGSPSFFNTSTTTGYTNGDDHLRFFVEGDSAATPLPSPVWAGLALLTLGGFLQFRARFAVSR
jgi:hypothetical protein